MEGISKNDVLCIIKLVFEMIDAKFFRIVDVNALIFYA